MAGPAGSRGLEWGDGGSDAVRAIGRRGAETGSRRPVSDEAFVHLPVMGREVVELLRPVPPGLVVDATVGGGGHSGQLLEARPDLRVLGIDRDPEAVAAAREALGRVRRPGASGARRIRGHRRDRGETRARGTSWGSCSTWV